MAEFVLVPRDRLWAIDISRCSDRQKDVARFMADYLAEYDRIPTFQTIARHFGFSSDNAAYEHVRALCRRGILEPAGRCGYRFKRQPATTPASSGCNHSGG